METWLRQQDLENNMIREIPPTGYDIILHPSIDGCLGGGVALIWKSSLNVKDKTDQVKAQNLTTMENADFTITSKSTMVLVYVIYKLPQTSVINLCKELADMLEEI